MEEFLIDIGGEAKDDSSKTKVAIEMKWKLRGKCKLFVANLLLKLQELFPIQYALERDTSFINSNYMAIQAAPISKRFVCVADLLYF